MEKRLCFVISPIGESDTATRHDADLFLSLIKTAGKIHNLDVKRADEVVISTDITQDIISLVQHADICVVDLTGLNPNVMYEFGMRFQCGLPYIVCAKQGTKLPFDVISKRTIFYDDIEKTSEYMRILEQIQIHLQTYEDRDYQVQDAVSLTDVYNLLQHINEKIEHFQSASFSAPKHENTSNYISVDELLGQLSVNEAFQYALRTNQITLAEQVLDASRDEPFQLFFRKLCALCSSGSDRSAGELLEILNADENGLSMEDSITAIGSVVSCFNRLDSEKEHLEEMNQLFDSLFGKAVSNKEKASILNQKERLYAGAGQYDVAKGVAEEVIRYYDEEPAYYYNYATVLKHLGDIEPAIENALKAINIAETPDDDHLSLVCELLMNSNLPEQRKMFEYYMKQLSEISPLKARLIRLRR